jgi:hypothetical protein
MMRKALAVVILAGCGTEEVVCRDGFTLSEDGHCYGDSATIIDDALHELPACEPVGGDGAIDLTLGCASGACVGMSVEQINEVLVEEAACSRHSNETARCKWSIGIDATFSDSDEDNIPNDGTPAQRIHLFPPYAGGTQFGVGIEANPRCFVDELGMPSWVAFTQVGSELLIQDLVYSDFGLWSYDRGSYDGSGRPNGYIDEIYLYGSP